jgi:hypothetical protein
VPVFLLEMPECLVRKRGLEPLCLAAPPPQDGVSAISPLPQTYKSMLSLAYWISQPKGWIQLHRISHWMHAFGTPAPEAFPV